MTKMMSTHVSGKEVRTCHECGKKMVGVRQAYDYEECGLSSVQLQNVLVFECECGLRSPEIPAISQLHVLIGIDLLSKRSLLAGEEVRFLRKMARLTQVETAEIMGVTATLPSKWERDGAGKETDRLMRTVFLLGMIQSFVKVRDANHIKSLAAEKFVQDIDVRELLKSIQDQDNGPKDVQVHNRPNASGDDVWFLPGLGEFTHTAPC